MADRTSGPTRRAAGDADDSQQGDTSRAGLFKRAALLGGAVVATGGLATTLPGRASSAAPSANDVRILNYILRLERLKAAFYGEAASGNALAGELQQLADLLARHEQAHVALLRDRLGGEAEGERTYDFGNATRRQDAFARTARTLEETAVSAYIGQGANLSRSLMVPFAELCSVEARHAAWVADILGEHPAPRAADEAKTPPEVVAVIQETGFEAAG